MFGWSKAVAGQAQTRFRGLARVDLAFTLTAAAYYLIPLPKGSWPSQPDGATPLRGATATQLTGHANPAIPTRNPKARDDSREFQQPASLTESQSRMI